MINIKAINAALAFTREMSQALRSVNVTCPETEIFINTLLTRIDSAQLKCNPTSSDVTKTMSKWQSAIDEAQRHSSNALLDTIVELEPHISWMNATRFWPEEEHSHFASNLSGSILIGQDDAAFTSEDKYIALLGVMSPDTTYPLHEHRIRELYYVVGGHAEWSHDAKEWVTLPAGSVFFNHSHEPHAFRTYNQFLIFVSLYLPPFGWEGGMVEVVK